MSPARKIFCSHFVRMGLLLLAWGTLAFGASITQIGSMTPTPIFNNPQTVPLFVPAFDSRAGTLNSASITLAMFAQFQATIGSTPGPFPVPVPEPVGFQAIVFPGLVKVGGLAIGNGFALQSLPAQTFVPSGAATVLSAPSLVQQETLSVFPFLLSSLQVPGGTAPIPIQLATGGLLYTPATAQSILLSELTILQAPYVSVTYNYTPFAPKPMAHAVLALDAVEASPAPEPAFLSATGLILLALGIRWRRVNLGRE